MGIALLTIQYTPEVKSVHNHHCGYVLYYHNVCVPVEVTWIGNRKIKFLNLAIISKNYVFAIVNASQITMEHTMSSQCVTAFTSRCLVAASNDKLSSFLWILELFSTSSTSC
jgi:hypothetical protein